MTVAPRDSSKMVAEGGSSSLYRSREAMPVLVAFFFVGVGKCGTSWIYEFMRRNRIGSVPSIKEPYLIDADSDRRSELVQELYEGREGLSDFSTLYYWDEHNPEKIAAYNPDARIVVTVRRPSERVVSHFRYMQKLGMHAGQLLSEYLEHDSDSVVARSDYAELIARYERHFDAERILVLPLEQLADDPQLYADRLTTFLSHPRILLSDEDRGVVRRAAVARNAAAARLAKTAAVVLRRMGLLKILGRLKDSSLLTRVLFREADSVVTSTVDFGRKTEQLEQMDADYLSLLGDRCGWTP